MKKDFIEIAKSHLKKYLDEIYCDKKFIIQFNGKFLIAISRYEIEDNVLNNLPSIIKSYSVNKNKFYFTLSKKWIKDSVSILNSDKYSNRNITIFSQITRLNYQLDNKLFGGTWDDDMYPIAKDILYLLHTNSQSIRRNIVKRCARRYNNLQIKGQIPFNLINGYKSALCMISFDYGE